MGYATMYPESITIKPLENPPDLTVTLSGSKSITNRALIMAALADGQTTLYGALKSEDTEVMQTALQALGIQIESSDDGSTIIIGGLGGHIPEHSAQLNLANSGTSIRFLSALCGLGRGEFKLDGTERMRMRPQADLLSGLNQLGVDAESVLGNGCPPLRVRGGGKVVGGVCRINAEASSQFLTALLMIAPYAENDVTVEVIGPFRPLYVAITTEMMRQWGVTVEQSRSAFHVRAGQHYSSQSNYQIEPDASAASYFFAAAALTGGSVVVKGLREDSLQGDVLFATRVLKEMGCVVEFTDNGIKVTGPKSGQLKGGKWDMSAISDTSLTLAAIAPFASEPTTVTGIAHARLQECDRISAICTELSRLGVKVDEYDDGFRIWPCDQIQPASLQTYKDHRMAMSLALIGLKVEGITILNPDCVAKTVPNYWQLLESLRS